MTFRKLLNRIRIYRHDHGTFGTVRFLSSRICRHESRIVFDSSTDKVPAPAAWPEDERLLVIDRSNVDTVLDSRLRSFLGGEAAEDNIDGVRKGDVLFVIAKGNEYRHCGYILFKTPECRIIGEVSGLPLIACCFTAPAARGCGIYRRALHAELRHLAARGYPRAIVETTPENIASIKGIEAAGFRLCRKVSAWIVLNRFVFHTCAEPLSTVRRFFVL